MIKFFKVLFFKIYKFWICVIFLFNRILQTLCDPWFGRKFQFLFGKLFKWFRCFFNNRLSNLGRYWFNEKLISFFSLHNIFSQPVWSKSEINFLLSNIFRLCQRILDFDAGNFEKNLLKSKLWEMLQKCWYDITWFNFF